MLATHHHRGAARPEMGHERVGDLRREAFLHLRAPREDVDHTRDLAQPDDLTVARQIDDVRTAGEGQQMVLADAEDLDVAHDHQVVGAGLVREDATEVIRRVVAHASEHIAVCARDTRRGFDQTIPVGVLADRDQDLPHGPLDSLQVNFVDPPVVAYRTAAVGYSQSAYWGHWFFLHRV